MSQFSVMTMEQIEAVAQTHNCEVIVAKPNELQYDLDQPGDKILLSDFVDRLRDRFKSPVTVDFWNSKSGNQHAVVSLPEELPVVERIALQAMGGSDPIREYAALKCHLAGSEHPILLFKPLRY